MEKVGIAEAMDILERYGKRQSWRPESIETSRGALGAFGRFLVEEGIDDLRAVDRAAMQRFQAWVAQAKSPATGNLYSVHSQYGFICAVRQAYAALLDEELVIVSVADTLVYPKIPRGMPTVLDVPEVQKLVSLPDLETLLGYRDRTILELLYSTLLRAGELAGLLLGDVQEESRRLFIRGKGGRHRVVPVGRVAWGYLTEYRDRVRPKLEPKDEGLFVNHEGRQLTRSGVSTVVAVHLRRTGKEGAAHVLRYTGATHMLENGADIREVQELLGHSRISTTMAYCLAATKALKRVHDRTHPRGKDGER